MITELIPREIGNLDLTELFPSSWSLGGWVARDGDGCISLFQHQPTRLEETKEWGGLRVILLPNYYFPEITWETGEKQVIIELK